MLTKNTTLRDFLKFPEFKGKEYMVDPMLDQLLKEKFGDSYDSLLKGKAFIDLSMEEVSKLLVNCNMPSFTAGLEYLLMRAKEETVFYDIWNEQERKEDASKCLTGLAAFPLKEKKRFILICPGGGYSAVFSAAEGYGIAKAVNEKGYAAFLLKYRAGADARYPNPVDDAAQAVRYIFEHAAEFGVDVQDYAVAGFSAGAHLAGCFGTEALGYKKYGLPKPRTLILGYPLVTMLGEKSHKGSQHYFLGKENMQNEQIQKQFSVEKQITEQFPSVYVWQCEEDETVSFVNSKMLIDKLEKYGIPCRWEVFSGKAHGWGLGIGTPAEGWLDRALQFWEDVPDR